MGFSPAGYMRTVYAGQTLSLPPAGRAAAAVPLSWPNKYVAETLDYTVDFSAYFEGEAVADVLESASVTSTPVDGALTISGINPGGQQVTVNIAAGTPGTQYAINLLGVSQGGREVAAVVALFVPNVVFTSGAFTSGSSS